MLEKENEQVDLTKQILKIIREAAEKQDISLSEFGRRSDVSKAWLSKLKHTEANLSIETAMKLLHSAGYTLQIVQTRKATSEVKFKRLIKKG